ncbi:bifunctional 4-hydroxy-2-oxoglutarate aldolase/2-dehydro-3-deoxy-phosphogluconate aldolase [Sphingobacterium sp. N143]|uniref:bifunctional 4-hydroxy-2-oxoglutarate aldolase/2-dehydro-3-deoxy-phosphogluconate aldolase n=1 Tax=Sphingobacterium sp. N143 TaxID=2746727 RepID=UPI0025772E72|nr:bifunctional 4-hydroxy-2-oxoglutarate aldolase/2-dehydro-3-deoxy-phosphogluconate aldolase [Sphingobacterium sp. N143]MDM1293941.1 bifunctional 4-hydroxy-2-oxoglutarate aldolase/2-dehydro-3-deoxy-phosphogluconate aldolase [Sphingobacterium sp. N143]
MQQILDKITESPIIPVFYDRDPVRCLDILQQCYEGGVRVFEFVNRGPRALENFTKLKSNIKADMILGMGTIKSPEEARIFLDGGADFIVSPIIDPHIAAVSTEKGKLWIPGCMTPTEINFAAGCGVPLIKLFPGDVLGHDFLKAVKPLFPDVQFMVTGGVKLERSNLNSWFKNGAFAVGVGSSLFNVDKTHPDLTIASQLRDSFSLLRKQE